MASHTPVHTRPTARHRRAATRQPLRRWAASLASGMLLFAGIGIASPASVDAASGIISGTVYRDLDNDGVRDRREPGVPGVVISSSTTSAITDANGRWTLRSWGWVDLQVSTGWYRSQCDGTECAPGPGRNQDFSVTDQTIVAHRVDGTRGARLLLGLLPDWPGGYPIPDRTIRANTVDVSARIGWATAENDGCAAAPDGDDRSCLVADSPRFLVQIMNEGTARLVDPKGYIELPESSWVASLTAVVTPAATSAMRATQGTVSIGSMNTSTRRVPFTIHRTLAPGAQANLSLTLGIRSDARTNGSPGSDGYSNSEGYSSIVGLRMTSVPNDPDSAWCWPLDTRCLWGTADTQRSPDNSDTEGFTILAPESPPATTSTTTTTTSLPTTTSTTTTTTLPPTTTSTTSPPTTTSTSTTSTTSTTTVAPTTTTPPAACSVSNLLVPSCGAWLGASTESLDGTYNYQKGMIEYEAVAQNAPDIVHVYKKGAIKFPTASDIALSERPGKQRSLLLINWKPSTSITWRQIADGGADAAIATVASGLRSYDHKLFVTVWHEPENDVKGAGSGYTPADYVAMYRHVVLELRAAGVTNAVFVMNYMGFQNWADMVDDLYPGNDVVDWIAYDPYGEAGAKDFALLLDRTTKAGWPGFYSWATAKAPGKPIMLAEWGFSLNTQPNAPAALDGGVAIVRDQFPMLKAFVYWNNHFDGGFQVRLDQPTDLGRAYGAAYQRFANDPYFNSTSTAAAV